MNAKDKAKGLVNLYYENLPEWVNFNDAKMCASKVVDEILNNSVMNYSGSDFSDNEILSDTEYWIEVKKEIELL